MLFLYASNFDEFRENVLFLPLLIALIFALLIYGITYLIFRKKEISSVLSSVIIIFSLSYKRIFDPIKENGIKANEIQVDIVILLILGIVIYLTLRYKDRLTTPNKFLTAVSLFLVGITLFTLVQKEIHSGRLWEHPVVEDLLPVNSKVASQKDPDIYYFIFDRYAGERSLKEQYNFDNTPFLNFLRKKGFAVMDNSTANYPKTFLSLASSLNMEYVNYMTEKTKGGASKDQSLITPLIRNNKVLKFLKERGYTYVHMGSWWSPTAENKNADIEFIMQKGSYPYADEFTSGFLNTTIAASLLKEILKDPRDVSEEPRNNDHRKRIYYAFNTMKEVPQIKGPKFVFVHILLPHDPFVVDKNCAPISEKYVKERTHQENYLAQLQCTNKNIEVMVGDILAKSKNPPIIIIQADEGPFPMNSTLSKDQAWKNVDDTALKEKFPILNAYYLPGKKDTKLYDTITPVNSFRVIFNTYFNTKYPLLEDRNYIFEDENHYYKFIDITDRIK